MGHPFSYPVLVGKQNRRDLKMRLQLIILLLVALSCWAGCSEPKTTLERIRAEGVVRVGYSNDAPFAYKEANGQLTGEAIEMARVLFKKIGVNKVEGVLVKFDDLITELNAGKFDVIAAGMFITPERALHVDFGEPTYCLGQAFLVKSGNPKFLHSYDDVRKQTVVKLAIVEGAVQEGYAKAANIPDGQIVRCNSTDEAFAAVMDGRADALALSSLSVNALAKMDKKGVVERAVPFAAPQRKGKSFMNYGAFAFKKKDRELRQLINKEIEKFLGSKEHLKLIEPFGFTESDLPKDVSAADLSLE